MLLLWHKPFVENVHNVLETAASSALLLTYYINLLLKVHPDASQLHSFAVMLILLMAGVLIAAIWAIWSIRSFRKAIAKDKATVNDESEGSPHEREQQTGAIQMSVLHDVQNPAYDEQTDSSATRTTSSESSGIVEQAARIAALESELELVKRSRAEYTAARIAAELQKVHQQHSTQLEKAVRAERERCSALATKQHEEQQVSTSSGADHESIHP